MDKIYIVMDYVEHDLKSLMETMKQPFLVGRYKLCLNVGNYTLLSFIIDRRFKKKKKDLIKIISHISDEIC